MDKQPPKPTLAANLAEQLGKPEPAAPPASPPAISITIAAGGTLNLVLGAVPAGRA